MNNAELEKILRATAAAVKESNIGVHACLRVILGSMNDGSIPELVHYMRIFATYRIVECGKVQAREEVEGEMARLFGWPDDSSNGPPPEGGGR